MRQSKAEKLIDKRIERAYYKTCSGVQVNIMDIPRIWRAVRNAMTPETTDAELETLVRGMVEQLAVAGRANLETLRS